MPASACTEWASAVLAETRSRVRGSRDIARIMAATPVFAGLLQYEGAVRQGAFQAMLALLGHGRFPKVRSHSAEALYLKLLAEEVRCDARRILRRGRVPTTDAPGRVPLALTLRR